MPSSGLLSPAANPVYNGFITNEIINNMQMAEQMQNTAGGKSQASFDKKRNSDAKHHMNTNPMQMRKDFISL